MFSSSATRRCVPTCGLPECLSGKRSLICSRASRARTDRCVPALGGATARSVAPSLQGGAKEQGSIIVVVATNAPLWPHQLKRLVTRVALGVGRSGGFGGNSSGDIFVAFSTANARVANDTGVAKVDMLPNARMNALFYATVQSTEEAILNAFLAAETMTGADEFRVTALPRDRLLAAMRKYGRSRLTKRIACLTLSKEIFEVRMAESTVTSKGQITIPKVVREALRPRSR